MKTSEGDMKDYSGRGSVGTVRKVFDFLVNTNDSIQRYYYKYLISHHINSANILDVGCGRGELLKLFKECGKDVTGIEPNTFLFRCSKIKDQIINGYFDIRMMDSKKYDLIILGQNIYYFSDGLKVIDKLDSMLSDRGYLFITSAKGKDCLTKNEIVNYLIKKDYKILDATDKQPICMMHGNIFSGKYLSYLRRGFEMLLCIFISPYKDGSNGYHFFILAKKGGI